MLLYMFVACGGERVTCLGDASVLRSTSMRSGLPRRARQPHPWKQRELETGPGGLPDDLGNAVYSVTRTVRKTSSPPTDHVP